MTLSSRSSSEASWESFLRDTFLRSTELLPVYGHFSMRAGSTAESGGITRKTQVRFRRWREDRNASGVLRPMSVPRKLVGSRPGRGHREVPPP
jgi:hypothetical protein